MKRITFLGFLLILIWACTPSKKAVNTSVALTTGDDSAKYEIVVMDAGFDQWYNTNYTPAKDRPNDYYRNKNLWAVNTWNDYFRTGRYRGIVGSLIDYRPDIDYGIEVNRKLYWYFRYIDDEYGVRLL